jgi:hypothetical protein
MKKQIKFFYSKNMEDIESEVNAWLCEQSYKSINKITPFPDDKKFIILVEYFEQ